MTTQRITKSLVDRLKSGCIVWDNDCRGFGVRRQVRDVRKSRPRKPERPIGVFAEI